MPPRSPPLRYRARVFPIPSVRLAAAALTVTFAVTASTSTSAQVSAREDARLQVDDGATEDRLGQAVAISGDYALVSARLEDTDAGVDAGAVYVFHRTTMGWTEQAKLEASDAFPEANFGIFLDIDGTSAAIANTFGTVYTFERSGTEWRQSQRIEACGYPCGFGRGAGTGSKPLALLGDTLVVGASIANTDPEANPVADPFSSNRHGAVFVFQRSDAAWVATQTLAASDGAREDFFGGSVALSDRYIVVGAIFGGPQDEPEQDAGAAYVFARDDYREMAQLTGNDLGARDRFGNCVAVADDTILVGASDHDGTIGPRSGAAYVFRLGQSWTQEAKLEAPDRSFEVNFARSLTLLPDVAIIGAPLRDDTPGSLVGGGAMFRRTEGGWTEQTLIEPSIPREGDQFGTAVDIDEQTLVVGSPNTTGPTGRPDAGAVYFFTLDGLPGTPTEMPAPGTGGGVGSGGAPPASPGDPEPLSPPGLEGESADGCSFVATRSDGVPQSFVWLLFPAALTTRRHSARMARTGRTTGGR